MSRIIVDVSTGLHYIICSSASGAPTVTRDIAAARKYFDIVMVSPKVKRDIPNVYHTIGGRGNTAPFHSRAIVIDSIRQGYEYYNSNLEDDIFICLNDVSSAFVRASSMDLIRRMLSIKGQKRVYDLVPRMNPMSRLANRSSDKALGSKWALPAAGGTFTFIVGGLTAALGWVDPIFMNHTDTALIVTAASAPLAAPFVGKTADYVLSSPGRSTKKILRHVEENVEFYERCTVKSSIMAVARGEGNESERVIAASSPQPDLESDSTSPIAAYGLVPIESIKARVEKLKDDWMEYELDPMKSLDYPLMLDATCEQTGAFLQSIRELDACLDTVKSDPSQMGRLAKLVEKAELRFLAAEANAQKMRLSYLDDKQKKQVMKVRSLAQVMKDESASPNEKKLAFEQANKELEGVLKPLSPKIIGLLEP